MKKVTKEYLRDIYGLWRVEVKLEGCVIKELERVRSVDRSSSRNFL